ncbi:MAG TPA: DNA (cytosine-5-)-methyltransferase [Candidatus Dormibacteraeota bacterium]|nr:DNA (cytosine-5-)-methyltransferase [Candidatus Dormibacteraeota bacterium]
MVELTQAQTLERIDELLEVTYRSADLGNLTDPLAETVYILLSRQTREDCYQKLFRKLRARYPRWMDVLSARPTDLRELLRPGGFHRARTRELVGILEAVRADNEARKIGPYASPPRDLTLDHLRTMSDAAAERFLDALPGIGPKSARCIQSYSLDRKRFAVDTHVHRIVERLGILTTGNRKADHDPLESAITPAIRKRLHMNLVHHGRAICTSQRPKCDRCVLVSFCRTGRVLSRDDRHPVAVELFAGAGGFGTGCRQEGFQIALAVELDRNAAQTYRANHPGVPVVEADVTRLKAFDVRRLVPGVGEPAVLLAGPPCQGYSAAGARQANDPKNVLFKHVSRLARELNAAYIVIENVPGLKNVQGFSFLHGVRVSLGRSHYAAGEYLLNAADFGVAQVRKRFIFLGRRRNIKDAPPPAPPAPVVQPVEGRLMRALEDLPWLPSGTIAEYAHQDNGTVLLNASTMAHSAAVVAKIARIKGSGKGPISYRRLGTDLAPTLIAGHRAFPVHPVLNRTISVREAARIQGFPDTYVFCGPRSTQPLQVANAVPPALARRIAAHIRGLMEEDGLLAPSDDHPKLQRRPAVAPPAVDRGSNVLRPHEKSLKPVPPTSMFEDEVALVSQ